MKGHENKDTDPDQKKHEPIRMRGHEHKDTDPDQKKT